MIFMDCTNDIRPFAAEFMNTVGFPHEAKEVFMNAEDAIIADDDLNNLFLRLKRQFVIENEIPLSCALDELTAISESCGIHEYTLHFVFVMNCMDVLKDNYVKEGISEEIFWDTADDLRCKVLECKQVKEIWGIFHAPWYRGFFAMTRFALGRMQFELTDFGHGTYEKNGFIVNNDDIVINMHIPSSGKPFDREARLDAYRRAYKFFHKDTSTPAVFVCHSWLLYKPQTEFLPKGSNILDFMTDFDIITREDGESFSNAWRVFGKYAELPPAELPRDTSLRRAYADRLVRGEPTGNGFGVFLFDGENIIR